MVFSIALLIVIVFIAFKLSPVEKLESVPSSPRLGGSPRQTARGDEEGKLE